MMCFHSLSTLLEPEEGEVAEEHKAKGVDDEGHDLLPFLAQVRNIEVLLRQYLDPGARITLPRNARQHQTFKLVFDKELVAVLRE